MLVIFMLVISQYLPWVGELNISAFSLTTLKMLPITTAVVSSVWLIYWVIQKRGPTVSQGSRIGWYIGAYGIYPIALFVGFINGGPLVAMSIEYIIEVIGGYFGIATSSAFYAVTVFLVGVCAGTFIATVIPCLLFALLGYQLGGMIHRLLRRSEMLLLLVAINLLLIFIITLC